MPNFIPFSVLSFGKLYGIYGPYESPKLMNNWVLFKVIFYFPNRESTIWGIYSEYSLFFGDPLSKSKINHGFLQRVLFKSTSAASPSYLDLLFMKNHHVELTAQLLQSYVPT